jgi:dephospho-CoA kinase
METTENMLFLKRVLVVDAPHHLQLTRTQERDECTLTLAEQMIASQISREKRLERADDVIVNEGDLTALQQQVKTLHKKYLHLAHLSAQ